MPAITEAIPATTCAATLGTTIAATIAGVA